MRVSRCELTIERQVMSHCECAVCFGPQIERTFYMATMSPEKIEKPVTKEPQPKAATDAAYQPRPLPWTRNDTNFWLDTALLIVFLAVLAITGILQFVFPGPMKAADWSLWGYDYSAWQTVQSLSIGVFAVLVIVHLILHWAWVCGVISVRFSRHLGRRVRILEPMLTLYGVAFLALCLFSILAVVGLAEFQIVEPPAQ